MKKYDVFMRDGKKIADGLTIRETIRKLLTHEGHKYRIVTHHSGQCDLYVSMSKTGTGRKKKWAAYGGDSKEAVVKKILELGGVYGIYAKETENK